MRRHSVFIGILLVAAVTRFLVLFHSQTHVHSDEAVIGLMGKHILEGRSAPFYMYGQSYNAGAAWEACLAAIPFAVFGVGVIPLKACIVCLSLACLMLFYKTAHDLYDRPTAALATLALALSPSLFKWHFQVRGYAFYFLSLPVLMMLWQSIETSTSPRANRPFLLGLASGLSVWCLELVAAPVAALWFVLALRRKLSIKGAVLGVIGFVIGYGPAIAFNLTHHFENWREAFVEKTAGGSIWRSLLEPSTVATILFQEMPKFFGPDTVLWYYPERPFSGVVFYLLAVTAVLVALWPFLRAPSKCVGVLRGDLTVEDKDFLTVVLVVACFVPYFVAPIRVPGYFLGGCFFLSLLTGRMLSRCFASNIRLPRLAGGALLSAIVLVGVGVLVDTGRRYEIETLTLDERSNFHLTRIPGAAIDGVEDHLRRNNITSAWTTISFVYPLKFECGENLAVSDAIFGWDRRVYPPSVPWRMPDPGAAPVIVVETDSPFRAPVEARIGQSGRFKPVVSEYGALTVIEGKPLNP